MAEVKIMVGGRQYAVHCRDGEETQLHQLAEMISARVSKVTGGSSGLTEVRQLLFASLLLADELNDAAKAAPQRSLPMAPPPPAKAEDDQALLSAIDMLSERLESLSDNLAANLPSA